MPFLCISNLCAWIVIWHSKPPFFLAFWIIEFHLFFPTFWGILSQFSPRPWGKSDSPTVQTLWLKWRRVGSSYPIFIDCPMPPSHPQMNLTSHQPFLPQHHRLSDAHNWFRPWFAKIADVQGLSAGLLWHNNILGKEGCTTFLVFMMWWHLLHFLLFLYYLFFPQSSAGSLKPSFKLHVFTICHRLYLPKSFCVTDSHCGIPTWAWGLFFPWGGM